MVGHADEDAPRFADEAWAIDPVERREANKARLRSSRRNEKLRPDASAFFDRSDVLLI
jgi:hypothetical protein